MLTFFRRIRKEILGNDPSFAKTTAGKAIRKSASHLVESSGHKTSGTGPTLRYVLYAIGEIALVVIGILIALQINSWNQDRVDGKIARAYLVRIQSELIQDTISFRNKINRNLELREEMKNSLKLIYDGIENKEQVIGIMGIYDEGLNRVFFSNSTTYTDLVSTGNLRLIKNVELKDGIVNLYKHYDEKRSLLKSDKAWMDGIGINMDSNSNFIKFSKEIVDIYTKPEMLTDKEWSFLNDKESNEFKLFERAFASIAWSLNVSNTYYKDLISNCNVVLIDIEKELLSPK